MFCLESLSPSSRLWVHSRQQSPRDVSAKNERHRPLATEGCGSRPEAGGAWVAHFSLEKEDRETRDGELASWSSAPEGCVQDPRGSTSRRRLPPPLHARAGQSSLPAASRTRRQRMERAGVPLTLRPLPDTRSVQGTACLQADSSALDGTTGSPVKVSWGVCPQPDLIPSGWCAHTRSNTIWMVRPRLHELA